MEDLDGSEVAVVDCESVRSRLGGSVDGAVEEGCEELVSSFAGGDSTWTGGTETGALVSSVSSLEAAGGGCCGGIWSSCASTAA